MTGVTREKREGIVNAGLQRAELLNEGADGTDDFVVEADG